MAHTNFIPPIRITPYQPLIWITSNKHMFPIISNFSVLFPERTKSFNFILCIIYIYIYYTLIFLYCFYILLRATLTEDGRRQRTDLDGRTEDGRWWRDGRTDRGRTTTDGRDGRTEDGQRRRDERGGRTDRWRRRRRDTTGHDGTRRNERREDTHSYMITKFQVEHWDQVSNVTINRPSTLRFRHPQ